VLDTDMTGSGLARIVPRAAPLELIAEGTRFSDGTLGPAIVLHTFGADYRGVHRGIEGLCLDDEGNVVAVAGWRRSGPGPLAMVFSPTGAVLESHPLPCDLPVNCRFGERGGDALYVTSADGCLYRARKVGRRGLRQR
jgi:gluconolactonase